MTLCDRVTAALDAAGIAHALIGGTALAAAGVVRSTLDIDLLTTDTRALDAGLWAPVRALADVEIRPGDADDPLAGVVRASQTGERPVDLIVGRSAWQRRAVDRARALPGAARVVLPRDLVLLKLFAGGAHDRWDVRQLLAVAEDALVREVEEDLPDLPPPAATLWRRLRDGG